MTVDKPAITSFLGDHFEPCRAIWLLQLALSALSVAELRSGWTEQDAGVYLPRLYDLALVIPVSDKVAEEAGAYREVYRRKGVILPTIDALIAATALFYAYCLVTRNKKDYPLPELDIYPTIG